MHFQEIHGHVYQEVIKKFQTQSEFVLRSMRAHLRRNVNNARTHKLPESKNKQVSNKGNPRKAITMTN